MFVPVCWGADQWGADDGDHQASRNLKGFDMTGSDRRTGSMRAPATKDLRVAVAGGKWPHWTPDTRTPAEPFGQRASSLSCGGVPRALDTVISLFVAAQLVA